MGKYICDCDEIFVMLPDYTVEEVGGFMHLLTSELGPLTYEDNEIFNQILSVLGQEIKCAAAVTSEVKREDTTESDEDWLPPPDEKDDNDLDNFDILDESDLQVPRKSLPSFKSEIKIGYCIECTANLFLQKLENSQKKSCNHMMKQEESLFADIVAQREKDPTDLLCI